MKCNTFEMTQLKIKLVKDIIAKKRKIKDAAEILEVNRKSVSRWKWAFIYGGESALLPKKPGPKNGTAWNRTSEVIEDAICNIAEKNPFKGPDWIADQLDIQINQSTVYRILKRKGARYLSVVTESHLLAPLAFDRKTFHIVFLDLHWSIHHSVWGRQIEK